MTGAPPAAARAGSEASPRQNQLLAALGADVWARWAPHLVPVDLERGQVLCEAGHTPSDAVFPTTAVVSLLHITRDGASAEVAAIGREGMVGMALVMGGNAASSQAIVQCSGLAWRLSAQMLRDEVQRAGPALRMLLRYTLALTAQVAQTAACNRHHTIDQQLSRRLLMAHDQSPDDELALTHEGLANLLGVRREGVTAAAMKLQQAGVIRYRRGHVEVLDRTRLETRSCECYGYLRREHDRLMSRPGRFRAADDSLSMGQAEPACSS